MDNQQQQPQQQQPPTDNDSSTQSTMGGGPGDGVYNAGGAGGGGTGGGGVTYTSPQYGGGGGGGVPASVPHPTTPYGQQQQQQQQSPSYASPTNTNTNTNTYTPQAGMGSVSRFATPDMSAQQQQQQPSYASPPGATGSYAARSNMYHQNANANAPQQQPQQQRPPSSGGYAARSAQAQAQTQAYQQQPVQSPAASGSSPAGGYAARSAQALYGSQQQQQQQQQPNQYAPQQPAVPNSGSYAARAAQAYSQPQQQQQQQQSSVTAASSGGSYATRSAQAYHGSNGGAEAANHQQQQQQQAGTFSPTTGSTASTHARPTTMAPNTHTTNSHTAGVVLTGPESPQALAIQQRLLTDATRKVQEHAYYMRQAMDRKELPVVLDRAAHMVGELGGLAHGSSHSSVTGGSSSAPTNTGASTKLTPKNYYELYMRALEDMPSLEEYLLNLVANPVGGSSMMDHGNNMIQIVASHATVQRAPYTMRELYDCVQYCPRVLSRLYLQAAAGSALIRSGEVGAKWVLSDLVQAVKCEQNPIRGLFLRHFLLQVLRDKLPDEPPPLPPGNVNVNANINASRMETIESEEELQVKPTDGKVEVDEQEKGTVKDSYEFILANFMEMNKLWVRIQHLPGEGKNKDVKKRRERERNELRILVGTNLVRLSQLECVTSKIYGEIILPQILDHIVVCGDPLSQAYLMDCLVQVFPDEYHIETLPILLNVCPRLRDKVNIRTILQGLMDRLANYLAEEELLDESDTNQVKKALARDSFGLFEESVQKVYNARGPKLTSKEVIRLQTALLQFSLKCYPGNMFQIGRCLGVCVSALRQANVSYEIHEGTVASVPQEREMIKPLDEVSIVELEKLLSIPLDSLALKVLELENYSELISFLPWNSRRQVAVSLLRAVDNVGSTPKSVKEIQELFSVIEPVIRDEFSVSSPVASHDATARATNLMAGLGVSPTRPESFVAGPSFNETDPEKLKDAAKLTALVSKLVHLLDHEDTDTLYEMLGVARDHIKRGDRYRSGQTLVAVVYAALRLARRVFAIEHGPKDEEPTLAAETANEAEADAPASTGDAAPSSTEDVPSVEEVDVEKKVDDDSKDAAEPSTEEAEEEKAEAEAETSDIKETKTKTISCRKVFIFVQETIAMLAKSHSETGVKVYLEAALTADAFAVTSSAIAADFAPIAYEFVSQAYSLYEETVTESKAQHRCISSMVGTLLALRSISKEDYESLITKTAQFSAKVMKKPDQCQLVALCAHLFYPASHGDNMKYSNPQRALECLQRSLKLADACTSANPSNVGLFVDLLEHYVYFFEKKNPMIKDGYITGLIALIKEHVSNLGSFGGDSSAVSDSKAQFLEVVRYIKRKKAEDTTAELFASIQVDNVGA